jgi:hypothetical protein
VSRATDRLRGDRRAWFGAGVVVLLIALAIAAPLVARHDPFGIDLVNSLLPPSRAHWFGTDVKGATCGPSIRRASRSPSDRLARIALSLGVLLGLVAGYYGRWVDELVMRRRRDARVPTLLLLIAASRRCSRVSPSSSSRSASSDGRAWRASSAARCSSCASWKILQAERALGARRARDPAARVAERHRARRHRRHAGRGRRSSPVVALVSQARRAAADAEWGSMIADG